MKVRTIFIGIASALLFTACASDDDAHTGPVTNGEQASVKFELDASLLNYDPSKPSLRYSPQYSTSGFRIYAFKEVPDNPGTYHFIKNVNLANMAYDATDNKLKGTDALDIGRYKFIAAYGLNQPVLSLPTWGELSDNYSITYNPSTIPVGEIFLPEGNAASLRSYEFGTSSNPNETVEIALKRAVARVDVMFFKGQRNGDGTYTELPYSEGNNVFGNKTIENIELRYQGISDVMGYFGQYRTTEPKNVNVTLSNYYSTEPNGGIITIGNNDTGTTIGNAEYTRYDNVQSGDMIYGAAHIFGNYLFPNADAENTTSLTVYIKPVNDIARTINVSFDNDHRLPIEKNRVTLVKIYVIDNGNGGGDPEDPEVPHVFSTNVRFEVEIDTVWEDPHEVTGEIE